MSNTGKQRSVAVLMHMHAGDLLPVPGLAPTTSGAATRAEPGVAAQAPSAGAAEAVAAPDWQSLLGSVRGQQRSAVPVFRPKLHLSLPLPCSIGQSTGSPAGPAQSAPAVSRRHRRGPLIVNITLSASGEGGSRVMPGAAARHTGDGTLHMGVSAAVAATGGVGGVQAWSGSTEGNSDDGGAIAAYQYDDTLSEAAAAMRLDSQQECESSSQPCEGQLEVGCRFSTRSVTVWRAAVPPAVEAGVTDGSTGGKGEAPAGESASIGEAQEARAAVGVSYPAGSGLEQPSRLVWWHCSEVIKGLMQKGSSSNTVG
jgi:hypothetical protein